MLHRRTRGLHAALPALVVSACHAPPVAHTPATGSGSAGDRLSVGDQDNYAGTHRTGTYQGDRAIPVETFLLEAGQPARAQAMRDRRRLKWQVGIAGGAAMIAGTLHAVLSPRDCEEPRVDPHSDYEACKLAREDDRLPGGLFAFGGLITVITAFYISDLRPSDAQLRAYARAYNRRRNLPPPDYGKSVRIAPAITGDGAGLVVGGSF